MDIVLLILGLTMSVLWLWITVLALLCLFLDPDLEPVQRWGQLTIVLLIPLLGATVVLRMVNDHSPEVVARFLIPWPFSLVIRDKPVLKGGPGSNGEELPGSHSAGASEGGGGGSH